MKKIHRCIDARLTDKSHEYINSLCFDILILIPAIFDVIAMRAMYSNSSRRQMSAIR